jgi:hypothetical protein
VQDVTMQEMRDLTSPGSLQSSTPILVSILAAGVLFDLGANGQMPGIWTPLFLLAVTALFGAQLLRSAEDRLLVATGLLFASLIAVRAQPFLMLANGGIALSAFALAAIPDERSIFRAPALSYVRKAWALGMAALRAPGFVGVPLMRALGRGSSDRARSIVRVFLIVVPVLAVFAALLASADRVFGDLLTPGLPHWNVGSIFFHAFFIAAGAGGAATLARAALGPPVSNVSLDVPRPHLGTLEWISVLAGVDALFGLFVGVQFAVLFGGKHRVLVTPGLTYAGYARSGFFQLIVVAALAVLVVLGVWDLGKRSTVAESRWFVGLTTLMVGLCGVILASAWKRLGLYESAFGFTLARFAATIAIVSTGFVLLAVLGCLWFGARHRVVAVVLTGALAVVLGVNLLNPDRFVTEHNVTRFDRTGKIDIGYLGNAMSADAVPALVAVLPRLSKGDAAELRGDLCVRFRALAGPRDARSWNGGRSAARAAMERAGIHGAVCGDLVPD